MTLVNNVITRRAVLVLLISIGLTAAYGQQNAPKPTITKVISATIWPAGYAEIWFLDAPNVHFITNVDVTVLAPSITFETPNEIYSITLLLGALAPEDITREQQLGNLDSRGLPKDWPQLVPPIGGAAQFVSLFNKFATAEQLQENAHTSDLLHRFYQTHRSQLQALAYQRQQQQDIATAAEAARLAALPPYSGPAVSFKQIKVALP